MFMYCKGLQRNNCVSVLPGYTPASYNEKNRLPCLCCTTLFYN